MFEALGFLAVVGVSAAVLALRVYVAQRTRRQLRAAENDAEPGPCWQCRSSQLESLAASVFRCAGCGAVQGQGAAEYLAAARRRAYLALAPDERRKRAGVLLSETGLLLLRLTGELPHVLELSRRDMGIRESHDEVREKQVRFAAVLAEVRQLQQQLEDGRVLLGSSAEVPAFDVALDGAAYVLDSSDIFDRGIHRDLQAAQRHVLELQGLHARFEQELLAKGSPYRSA